MTYKIHLPFLLISNSSRFVKFPISGGRRAISLSLKPKCVKLYSLKNAYKMDMQGNIGQQLYFHRPLIAVYVVLRQILPSANP